MPRALRTGKHRRSVSLTRSPLACRLGGRRPVSITSRRAVPATTRCPRRQSNDPHGARTCCSSVGACLPRVPIYPSAHTPSLPAAHRDEQSLQAKRSRGAGSPVSKRWRQSPMKNKLEDLNNHLFAQLERLSDEKLTDKQLATEIERTKAITSVASEIVAGGKLQLDAQKALGDGLVQKVPPQLGHSGA